VSENEIVWGLAGLAVTLVIGHRGVKKLMEFAVDDIRCDAPTSRLAQRWEVLIGTNEGGRVIGYLERVLFFVALYAMGRYGVAAIGALLTFKLGAKWQVRSHMNEFPSTLGGAEPMEYLIARSRLGSRIFVTFVVGSFANVVIALAGVGAAQLGASAWPIGIVTSSPRPAANSANAQAPTIVPSAASTQANRAYGAASKPP
jgi:hypothetical protein